MIQNFRRLSHPHDIVRATFYTGHNLSEVAMLGIDVQVKDGDVKVLYSTGCSTFLSPLADNTWVFEDPDMPGSGAAKLLNEGPFRAIYGYPLSDDAVAKLKAQVEAEEHAGVHVVSAPRRIHVFVYGDDREGLIEAAAAEGHKAFGEDADLKIDFGDGGFIRSHDDDKPEYCGSANVYDVTGELPEPKPEPTTMVLTVRAGSQEGLRAEAMLRGRHFFGLGPQLRIDFTGPVRDCTLMGRKEYSAEVTITRL